MDAAVVAVGERPGLVPLGPGGVGLLLLLDDQHHQAQLRASAGLPQGLAHHVPHLLQQGLVEQLHVFSLAPARVPHTRGRHRLRKDPCGHRAGPARGWRRYVGRMVVELTLTLKLLDMSVS